MKLTLITATMVAADTFTAWSNAALLILWITFICWCLHRVLKRF